MIDRLKTKGLVESRRNETDMRRLDISLSPEGAVFVENAVETARDITQATLRNLTPREQERLLALLDKL